jgi:hypothetical protein
MLSSIFVEIEAFGGGGGRGAQQGARLELSKKNSLAQRILVRRSSRAACGRLQKPQIAGPARPAVKAAGRRPSRPP